MKLEEGRDLVALVGGPRNRWWYYADDFAQMRAAARHTGHGTQDVLAYMPTQERLVHPSEDDVDPSVREPRSGVVWIFQDAS